MLRLSSSYGHRQILVSYAGHEDQPVHAFIQHGWTVEPDAGNGQYAGSRFFRGAPRLCWSARQAREARAAGIPSTVAIGSPFLYLASMLDYPIFHEEGPFDYRANRILVYPNHSAEFLPPVSAMEGLGDIRDAVADGNEVSVSLHPLDQTRDEVVARYREVGARVVAHGRHRYDSYFLVKQFFELLRHDLVWSYGLGSAAFYAAALGRRVQFFPTGSTFGESTGELPGVQEFSESPGLYELLELAGSFREFARLELGVDHLLGVQEMAELLGLSGYRSYSARGLRIAGRAQAAIRHRFLGDERAAG